MNTLNMNEFLLGPLGACPQGANKIGRRQSVSVLKP